MNVEPFPVQTLQATGGHLYAQIFKNEVAAVPESLFWGLEIHFSPVEFRGEPHKCSLSADWISLPSRMH